MMIKVSEDPPIASLYQKIEIDVFGEESQGVDSKTYSDFSITRLSESEFKDVSSITPYDMY